MNKIFAFDLDNTLYEHQDFVKGAYKDVAAEVEKRTRISANDFYIKTINLWKILTSQCNHIFSDTLKEYGQYSVDLEKQLILVYRNHIPNIKPYYFVKEGLIMLNNFGQLALLSDGQPSVQRRKLSALKLEKYFDLKIYTGSLGREYYKPHSAGFKKICTQLKVNPNEVTYIGDNPYTDFETPKKLGMKTIRVKTGEYKSIDHISEYVDIVYDTIDLFFKSFLM